MNIPVMMHAAGVVCLIGMAAAAAWTIYSAIAPNFPKILAALRGQPVPPAASFPPHGKAHSTPLRRVEAAAEPTLQVEP